MAEKRMFAAQILCSDAFLDLPYTAQALYVQLNLKADDDGFVGNPKSVLRMTGTDAVDLDILKERRFILGFENTTVVCIKHWRVNNTIRWDRYTPTPYQAEALRLSIKSDGGYTETQPGILRERDLPTDVTPYGNHVATKRLPPGATPGTQIRLDEMRIDKKSVIDSSKIETAVSEPPKKRGFVKPTIDEIYDYCFKKHYFIDPDRFFHYYESKGWMVGTNKMTNWKSALSGWALREMERTPQHCWTETQFNYLYAHPEYGNADADTLILGTPT
jgi:hypothetical protein